MNQKEQCQIGTIPITIYIIYGLYITCCTYVDMLGYYLECELFPWITGLMLILVITFLWIKRTKKSFFRLKKVHKSFWYYILVIMLLTFIRSIHPDFSYDTYNYQLLAQERFIGGFEGELAPGYFQYYGFSLGSRMFYPIRQILGFRLGTMLTGGVLCLTMYQLVEIMSRFAGSRLIILRNDCRGKNSFFTFFLREEFIAFLIIFVPEAFVTLSGYYVEILMFPLILEACYILMFEECEQSTLKIWFVIVIGLLFAMKMTNIVYIVPILILFLWKNRKTISVKLFFLCLLIAMVPILPYIVLNWIELKNPIFPYFNSIFKSPFFPIGTDFKDNRWGPANVKELILWPLYTILKPEYRQLEIPRRWTGDFFCGFIVWLIYVYKIIESMIKRKNVDWSRFSLCIICGMSFWAWAATTGVSRYYMHGFVLFSILAWDYIINRLYKSTGIKNIIAILFSLGFVIQLFIVVNDYKEGREFSGRAISVESIKEQLPLLLIDRVEKEKVDLEIDAFLQQDYMGGLAYMSNSNAPIYRCDYYYNYRDEMNQSVRMTLEDEITELMKQNVYTVEPLPLLKVDFFNILNERKIYAESVTNIPSNIFRGLNSRMFVKLKPLDDKINRLYSAPINISEITTEVSDISAYVFFSEGRGWLKESGNFLRITAINDEQEEVIYFEELNEEEVLHVCFTMDFTKWNKRPKLVWEWVDANGIIQENWLYRMNIMNPTINGVTLDLNLVTQENHM